MGGRALRKILVVSFLVGLTTWARAQSFRVQCPTSTITHPSRTDKFNAEPAYTGPTVFTTNAQGYVTPTAHVNGAIKCQQVSGGDGYSTMANGVQTFMFSFGPLSGLADIANGLPGTEFPAVFNTTYPGTLMPGDPAATDGIVANTWPAWPTPNSTAGFTYNGAVGLAYDIANLVSIYDIAEAAAPSTVVVVQANAPLGVTVGQTVTIAGTGTGYDGTWTVTGLGLPAPLPSGVTNYGFPAT